jgi:hypothetical protein
MGPTTHYFRQSQRQNKDIVKKSHWDTKKKIDIQPFRDTQKINQLQKGLLLKNHALNQSQLISSPKCLRISQTFFKHINPNFKKIDIQPFRDTQK